MITIERYKNTRHWAVWQDNTLLAVVCYKKGAQAIKQILDRAKPTQKAPARIKSRRNRS